MTSQSAIFNRCVNLIASVDASVKKYPKIYLKKLKFLLITVEIVEKMYINVYKTANRKFSLFNSFSYGSLDSDKLY